MKPKRNVVAAAYAPSVRTDIRTRTRLRGATIHRMGSLRKGIYTTRNSLSVLGVKGQQQVHLQNVVSAFSSPNCPLPLSLEGVLHGRPLTRFWRKCEMKNSTPSSPPPLLNKSASPSSDRSCYFMCADENSQRSLGGSGGKES